MRTKGSCFVFHTQNCFRSCLLPFTPVFPGNLLSPLSLLFHFFRYLFPTLKKAISLRTPSHCVNWKVELSLCQSVPRPFFVNLCRVDQSRTAALFNICRKALGHLMQFTQHSIPCRFGLGLSTAFYRLGLSTAFTDYRVKHCVLQIRVKHCLY